jgi:hypothetical protein
MMASGRAVVLAHIHCMIEEVVMTRKVVTWSCAVVAAEVVSIWLYTMAVHAMAETLEGI